MNNLFKIRGKISNRQYVGISVAFFITIIVVWTVVTEGGLVETMFLPSPLLVINNIVESFQSGALVEHAQISIFRIVMGFLLAALLGIPLGILVGSFKFMEALLRPFCEFIRYMPVPAFVPLVMVWGGIGEFAKIIIVFLGTFFQVLLMVADDAMSVSDDLLNASYTLGAKRSVVIRKVLIPGMAPRLMETLRMTIGWAWTYLIVAELVASSSGIGYSILRAQRFFQTEALFAWILVIGIIGLITDRLFALAIKLLFPWDERNG